nr:response regulator [Amylibacter sp.]
MKQSKTSSLNDLTLSDLARFDEASSASGLLRRYTFGRMGATSIRMLIAAIGCALLAILVSPKFGLLATAVTFPLELVEYLILGYVRKKADYQGRKVHLLVIFASFVQTSGLGICMVLAASQSESLRMFSWAFLFGAMMNSLLSARFHPASHRVRLGVLAVAGLIILFRALTHPEAVYTEIASEMSAVLSMIFMVGYLFSHLSRRAKNTRQTERALIIQSAEARRLALVAEHASDSIVLMDENHLITWANSQFTDLTGYTLDDAIGHGMGELLNHVDADLAVIKAMNAKIESGQSTNARILNKTKSGATLWMETHQTPVFTEDGKIRAYIAVERDVSELVRREKELHAALDAAKKADQAKTEFLSRMSHELRTPANGLYGGMEILRETALSADQKDAVAILETSSNRLMHLVENIVTVTDVESGRLKVELCDMCVSEVLEAVASLYRAEAADKNVAIQISVDSTAQKPYVADPDLVSRILANLLSNSIKFTDKGAITMYAQVDTAGQMQISVQDTGIGIDRSKLALIFNAFEQVDNGNTRQFDGAGLGLSTARDLARLMGAEIEVEAELDKGSLFRLVLPLNERRHVSQVAVCKPVAPHHMRVLVAEDNGTNRLLIKTMLKGAGHELEFAQDGKQAVEQYALKPFDFVLMDISMPNKNGLEATREIRAFEAHKHLRRCPIIAVTANVSVEDQRLCFEAGMDEFIAKPLKKELLLQTIGNVIAASVPQEKPLL